MIKDNSGKIYRFKLDHHLGYGFAEVYDFTDHSMFDGRIVYVYTRVDNEEKKEYSLTEIKDSGIALGPIRLYNFPNTRGLHAWKYLFQNDRLIISELPETKELHGLVSTNNNWNNIKGWYVSNRDKKTLPTYVAYQKVRHLETRIVNASIGVAREFTMKIILDRREKVSDYYDLTNIGNKNMFVYLINTYYSLKKTKDFLKRLPTNRD